MPGRQPSRANADKLTGPPGRQLPALKGGQLPAIYPAAATWAARPFRPAKRTSAASSPMNLPAWKASGAIKDPKLSFHGRSRRGLIVSTPAERAGGGHRPRRLVSVPVMQSLVSQLLAHQRYSVRQSFRPQSILASFYQATSGSGRTRDNDREDGQIGLWLPLILGLYSQKATKTLSFSYE